MNFFDPTGLYFVCGPLKQLIDFEKKYGKLVTRLKYNPLNNYHLPDLNNPYPSIFGDVDIDWMFRSEGSYAIYIKWKTAWNSIWDNDENSMFEYSNFMAPYVFDKWWNSDLTLEDIFRPAIDQCKYLGSW